MSKLIGLRVNEIQLTKVFEIMRYLKNNRPYSKMQGAGRSHLKWSDVSEQDAIIYALMKFKTPES